MQFLISIIWQHLEQPTLEGDITRADLFIGIPVGTLPTATALD